ncbi:hypothetical protein ABTX77_36445 [Streptomyces sp. NPDC097704]|uniref:hypothetical protein n=1 Tax=Streptomyces sp. NPDC097704 TaxID=3157101 RepID=UPI00331AE743
MTDTPYGVAGCTCEVVPRPCFGRLYVDHHRREQELKWTRSPACPHHGTLVARIAGLIRRTP